MTQSRIKHITVTHVDFHRNGVAGSSFHTVDFKWNDTLLTAVVFESPGHIAIFRTSNQVANHFDSSSMWRGDEFEDIVRAGIKSFTYPDPELDPIIAQENDGEPG